MPALYYVLKITSGNSITGEMNVFLTGAPPTITTEALPDEKKDKAYNATVEAEGSTPITWSIISGELPPGLTLDPSTGVISETPT